MGDDPVLKSGLVRWVGWYDFFRFTTTTWTINDMGIHPSISE